jgi:hypothetical protein
LPAAEPLVSIPELRGFARRERPTNRSRRRFPNAYEERPDKSDMLFEHAARVRASANAGR